MAFNPADAIALIDAGVRLTALATRALEAANNGDQGLADVNLAKARQHYETARAGWDSA